MSRSRTYNRPIITVGFLHTLARGIRLAAARNEITLPDLPRAALEQEPFTVFDEWLTQIGAVIANDQREAMRRWSNLATWKRRKPVG